VIRKPGIFRSCLWWDQEHQVRPSLGVSCQRHGKDAHTYLRDVLARLVIILMVAPQSCHQYGPPPEHQTGIFHVILQFLKRNLSGNGGFGLPGGQRGQGELLCAVSCPYNRPSLPSMHTDITVATISGTGSADIRQPPIITGPFFPFRETIHRGM
jgi:hypothetical protein